MPDGGCFCNKIHVSYTDEPNGHALCHCLDCRKISGGLYSNNLIAPEDNFKLQSGTPKQISKQADSGKKITSHFCPDCGTTLYRANVPKAELFAPRRPEWVAPIKDATQVKAMPPY